jgi:hypothetical protein
MTIENTETTKSLVQTKKTPNMEHTLLELLPKKEVTILVAMAFQTM